MRITHDEHLTEVIRQKGGFSGADGRSSTLPCHEVRVLSTLLLEERGSGGSAPRDWHMVKD